MADLLDTKGGLESPPNNRSIFECYKKPNVKILAFPSGLHISCPSHHFQGFSPCENPASFQSISGISKDKLDKSN